MAIMVELNSRIKFIYPNRDTLTKILQSMTNAELHGLEDYLYLTDYLSREALHSIWRIK